MNGNGQGDARARLNVPVHGWAPGLRWPMQNRRICTVAGLPELGWAADQIGRVGVRAGLRPGPLLRGDGIPADRVHVIPPGYDPVLFAAAAAADPFPGLPRPRVAYLGRLVPQKDVGTLLEAFAQLAAGAQLLVVGDGPDRPALQRRAQPFGSRVHFAGFVPHIQVPAVLRHADMLVLPSLYEDLSSALIEAMAAGLPVVATRVGGTADLVQDGVNGLLVAPRDPAALAAAINRVLADPAAADRLSSAARRTAAAYGWPDLARDVLDVYRQVTGRGGAAGG